MKIYNLNDQKEISKVSEAIVIGSGPVGLFTAWQLSKLNIKVHVFESGKKDIPTEFLPIDCDKQINHGLKEGRKQVLGGTSTIWGGALLPFLKQDLKPHILGWHQGWPIKFKKLLPYYKEVELFFGLKKGSFSLEETYGNKYLFQRTVNWPKFKRRNAFNSLKQVTNKNNNINIYFNAKVTNLVSHSDNKYEVEIFDNNGRKFKTTSYKIFLSAGAIESFRIVSKLLSKFTEKKKKLQECGFGHYFQDHLSAPIANIVFKKSVNLSSKIGVKFNSFGMVNYRYEISNKMKKKFRIPSGFIHLSFERQKNNPFEILRGILQDLQANRIPEIKKILRLIKNTFYLLKVFYNRIVSKELFVDQNSQIFLNLVLEQIPKKDNRFNWDFDKNIQKQNNLSLSWQIYKQDLKNFNRAIIPICDQFFKIEKKDIEKIIVFNEEKIEKYLYNEGEVYHPVGFFKFSKNSNHSILNSKLELSGFKNLHVLNTGIFPSGGGANPTMTLLLISAYLINIIYKGKI